MFYVHPPSPSALLKSKGKVEQGEEHRAKPEKGKNVPLDRVGVEAAAPAGDLAHGGAANVQEPRLPADFGTGEGRRLLPGRVRVSRVEKEALALHLPDDHALERVAERGRDPDPVHPPPPLPEKVVVYQGATEHDEEEDQIMTP